MLHVKSSIVIQTTSNKSKRRCLANGYATGFSAELTPDRFADYPLCVPAEPMCSATAGFEKTRPSRKNIQPLAEFNMHGGSRPGAGRKPGKSNKEGKVARAKRASLDGALPHEMLLAIARGQSVNGHTPTFEQQLEAMAKAAPYYAPRFASKVEHTGANGGPIQFADLRNLTDEQLAALAPVLSALAATGAPAGASTH